jgi:hypothetical protein
VLSLFPAQVWNGSWDPTQARSLLKYTHDEGLKLWGVELGNELGGSNGIEAKLSPEVREAGVGAWQHVGSPWSLQLDNDIVDNNNIDRPPSTRSCA